MDMPLITKTKRLYLQEMGLNQEVLLDKIERLDLDAQKKDYLRERWMRCAFGMARRYLDLQTRDDWGHGIAIFLGALTPAFVSLNVPTGTNAPTGTSTGLSLVRLVAITSSVLLAFFTGLLSYARYGERRRHYRVTCERLVSLGWQFLNKSGPFRKYATQDEAFAWFEESLDTLLEQSAIDYTALSTGPGSEPEKMPGKEVVKNT